MLKYAEHEFTLSKPDQDGTTTREHLEQVERQTGVRPQELNGPEFPHLVSHIWFAFLSLNGGRSQAFSGVASLSALEIKSWCELSGEHLSPRDFEAVKKLDGLFVRVVNG